MKRSRFLAIPLLLAAGCDSPTDSRLGGDAYELKTVGGDPVPAVVSRSVSTTVVVLADTLRFFADGRGVHVRHQEVTESSDSGSAQVYRVESELGYVITGERIAITLVCPAYASCIRGPHLVGVIAAGTLRLDSNVDAGGHVYEVVSE